jgi:hypothetical protein
MAEDTRQLLLLLSTLATSVRLLHKRVGEIEQHKDWMQYETEWVKLDKAVCEIATWLDKLEKEAQ